MENTLTIYVASRNEHWEMPDALALKWEQYETDHPLAPDGSDADERHTEWFNSLTPKEQSLVTRRKAEN